MVTSFLLPEYSSSMKIMRCVYFIIFTLLAINTPAITLSFLRGFVQATTLHAAFVTHKLFTSSINKRWSQG